MHFERNKFSFRPFVLPLPTRIKESVLFFTWNSLARSLVYRATLNMSAAEIFIKMTARDTHEIDFLSSTPSSFVIRFLL